MTDMPIKEALTELKASIEGIGFQCHLETYETAIEALEKQIPEKPKDGKYAGTTVCPVCDMEFGYNTGFEYCERCGQRLDWGDE